jgi:phytanoyl-CoA hydroxylase
MPAAKFVMDDRIVFSPRRYYETCGYYVWQGLIDKAQIDVLLSEYANKIVPAKTPFYRQSTSRYEKNVMTPDGFVSQSFLDIHQFRDFPEFSRYAMEIYTSTKMRDALRDVTGFESFNLMQTMLFDANTETWPHQDWWYLDSVPNGHLLAVWIALEDIDERAGRFYVIPGSQAVDLHSATPNLPHTEWVQRMRRYVNDHGEEIHAPAMKKGDVLFWNSRTIHGSLPNRNPSFSRKSLTAHYLPSQFAFGNLFIKKDWIRYREYAGMKYYRNQPDYSLFNRIKYGMKTTLYDSPWVMRNLRKVQTMVRGFHDGL